ncbi:MAG: hypothetical protein AABW67_02465 [Nanoarchaeota archaeon]
MAAGIIFKPGSKFGHCRNECKHIDCKEIRKDGLKGGGVKKQSTSGK